MNILLVLVLSLVAIDTYKPRGPHQNRNNKFVLDSTNAADADAPYQVSITSTNWIGEERHNCSGVLVSARAVLTVAQCCEGYSPSVLKVRFGGTDRTNLAHSIAVYKVTMSTMYNSSTLDHDYCVLRLTNAVGGSNYAFISIATSSAASGAKAQLTGWGRLSQHSPNKPILPTKMQKANLNIVSSVECKKKWLDNNILTKNMVCASSKISSGCIGDPGGPLVVNGKLVGLLSWGYNGCPTDTTTRPLVFADVTELSAQNWIETNSG